MFKIYDEPESPSKGPACFRYVHERACVRYIYGEPEPQHEAGCFRDMVNRNRQVRGRIKTYDEPVQPISPNEGACLSHRTNRNRQMRGRV